MHSAHEFLFSDVIQLEADDIYNGDIKDDTILIISSTRPIVVAQYIKSSPDPCTITAEPSMVMIPAVDSFFGNVTFPVMQFTIAGLEVQFYSINVVIKCEFADGLVFDDTESMANWDRLTSDDGTICVVRGPVAIGTHSVNHPTANFTVTIYMVCYCSSSYAYQAIAAPFSCMSGKNEDYDGNPILHFTQSCVVTSRKSTLVLCLWRVSLCFGEIVSNRVYL